MTQGYRLLISHKPALSTSGLQPAVQDELHRQILEQEVATLLSKGAIREVEKADHQAGFFSHYFLIPKRDRGLRPVLDLRGLNQYLRPLWCRMRTVPRERQAINQGDWFATVDLKDAYLERALVLPSVPIWGQNLQVYGPPLRYHSGTSNIHKVHGRSPQTPSSTRPQGPQLFGQLAGVRPDTTDVHLPCCQAAAAHQEPGASYKRKKRANWNYHRSLSS